MRQSSASSHQRLLLPGEERGVPCPAYTRPRAGSICSQPEVAKLDRLARSLPDAWNIPDEITAKVVSLSLGGRTYDPADPVGRLLFNVLGMVAEFVADLSGCDHARVWRSRGRLSGKQPDLSAVQRKPVLSLDDAGEHRRAELAELFSVSRTTVYREIQRRGTATKPADGP